MKAVAMQILAKTALYEGAYLELYRTNNDAHTLQFVGSTGDKVVINLDSPHWKRYDPLSVFWEVESAAESNAKPKKPTWPIGRDDLTKSYAKEMIRRSSHEIVCAAYVLSEPTTAAGATATEIHEMAEDVPELGLYKGDIISTPAVEPGKADMPESVAA